MPANGTLLECRVANNDVAIGGEADYECEGDRHQARIECRAQPEPAGKLLLKLRRTASPGLPARREFGWHDLFQRRRTMARLTPITSKDQIPAKDYAIVDAIVGSRGALQGPFSMFLHCPELAGRVAHLGAFVRFEGSLDMRVRVLAAMTAAREFDAVYVWGAQTGSARRQGVPEATITAIREKHTRGVSPEDAQVIDFTLQLIRKHRVDDATFKAVQARFGKEQLLQLTGAIGYYVMLAMTVNACELEAAPGAEVLKP
jgi:4-carboxymuconolactone decarboxylase